MAEGGERRSPTSHRTPGQITRQVKGYNHRPENIRKRVQRDKARRLLTKEFGKEALAGKDVGHKKPIRSEGTNARSNLSIQDRSTNRAWEKKGPTVASNKSGYKKPKPHPPGVFRGGVNTNKGSGVETLKKTRKPPKNPKRKAKPKAHHSYH